MVAVFAAFGTGDLIVIKSLGVGMAIAVLLDATIIRALLVPATMRLLGRWAWWAPARLSWLSGRLGFSHVETDYECDTPDRADPPRDRAAGVGGRGRTGPSEPGRLTLTEPGRRPASDLLRDLGGGLLDGVAEDLGDLVQLVIGDHERRPQQDGVAVRAVRVAGAVVQQQAGGAGVGHHAFDQRAARGKGAAWRGRRPAPRPPAGPGRGPRRRWGGRRAGRSAAPAAARPSTALASTRFSVSRIRSTSPATAAPTGEWLYVNPWTKPPPAVIVS
jgi:hypothetical protein